MNVKFKSALAVAALALGASAAQASIPAGDIVFMEWNQTAQNAGYTFDTGLNASSWDPSVQHSYTLSGTDAVAAFNTGNVQWNLFGTTTAGDIAMSTNTNNPNSIGIPAGEDAFSVQPAVGQAGTVYQQLTSGQASAPPALVWANFMSSGGGSLAQQTDKVGAGVTYFDTLSSADGAATLFSGSWTLSFNAAAGSATSATLTWNPTSTSVPLPAAVWLLGSGLMGLAGVGRRRKIAVA